MGALDLIKAISPIAWQHINLFGNLDFNAAESGLDLEALAARYADPEYGRQGGSDDLEDSLLHEQKLIFNFSRGWANLAKMDFSRRKSGE